MESEVIRIPPPKPEVMCEGCGKPLEMELRDDWQKYMGPLARQTGMLSFLAYEEIPHPACADGIRRKESDIRERELAEERAKIIREKRDALGSVGNLPVDFSEKSFESFKPQPEAAKVVEILKRYHHSDEFGLLLMGASGIGKTHLLLSLMNREMDRLDGLLDLSHRYPVYFNASEFLSACRKNNFEPPEEINSPGWFILDDLGTENITEWSREILYRVFETRVRLGNLKTLVSTNLNLNELKDRLNERTASRLLELCIPVEIKGVDMRRERMKAQAKEFFSRH